MGDERPDASAAVHAARLATKLATLGLVANALLDAGWSVVWLLDAASLVSGVGASTPAGMNPVAWIGSLVFLFGVATFCLWVSRAFRCARALGSVPKRYSVWGATAAFFVPVFGLYRPYQTLRALDAAIDPASLPEPPPRADPEGGSGGYRDAATQATPRPLRRPPLRAWWALWVSANAWVYLDVLRKHYRVAATLTPEWRRDVGVVYSVAMAACAVLTIAVVRRMDARLAERARRIGGLRPAL